MLEVTVDLESCLPDAAQTCALFCQLNFDEAGLDCGRLHAFTMCKLCRGPTACFRPQSHCSADEAEQQRPPGVGTESK